MNGVAMAVAVYMRVSTEEQRERQSIATQREFAEKYTDLHQLAVFRTYADDGYSGALTLEHRPEANEMMRDARASKFDQLLVYKLDRLGRDTRLILNAVAELEKLGVRVRSMTEEFDTGTATGRLMLTLLAGFASHERDTFRERSMAGVNRLAEAGVWLGGVVPFGYVKIGSKRDGKLVISDDPIPGLAMSEADVVKEIFRMAAIERKSCRQIAERLNALRIPPVYTRADRLVTRGKRKERTAGIWRPGRIRNLIVSKTYMGVHEFGKRSAGPRSIVSRTVPAIVTLETWQKAQDNLQTHFLFCARSAKRHYLLRGLIKCGVCGLTYIGMPANTANGKDESYYRCNGAHSPDIYRPMGRCQSKTIRGDQLERQLWADIQAFLRNPKPVLEKLQVRMEADAKGTDSIRKQIERLETLLAEKATERTRILGLYRRGRLNDGDLDTQMEEIGREDSTLQMQIRELRDKIASAESIDGTISSAQALLDRLRQRLDQPISFDQKRRLIEILVAGIQVDTVEICGVKQAEVTVTYRFSEPDRPAPVILPHSYSGSVIRIPLEPKTIGDHIRKKRLLSKLLQREVAEKIGVNKTSIHYWEVNSATPDLRYMPAIIQFLGYNPLPAANALGERLVRHRRSRGITQADAARRMGVDQGTLARWERGERGPSGKFVAIAERFLAGEPEDAAVGKTA
jgi:site-specific DNA recombinase